MGDTMKLKVLLFTVLFIFCFLIIVIGVKITEANNDVNVSINFSDSSVSSIAMDRRTKRVLYENNIHKRMLPASTTKIMTALVAIKYYDLDDFVVITNDMINVEGSRIYLEVGDVISVKDLLYGLMLRSGNDAAMALAYHYSGTFSDFIYLMNETAKEIGMKDTTFENPHGLDSSSKNYISVYDMALLMSTALEDDTFRMITKTKNYKNKIISGKFINFSNKHKLILNNELVTGGKTGFTKNAKRTLVTSFMKEDFEIIVVSFNCSDDWNLHLNLADYCFNRYKLKSIASKIELLVSLDKKTYFKSTDLLFPTVNNETVTYEIGDNNIVTYYINDKKVGYINLGKTYE